MFKPRPLALAVAAAVALGTLTTGIIGSAASSASPVSVATSASADTSSCWPSPADASAAAAAATSSSTSPATTSPSPANPKAAPGVAASTAPTNPPLRVTAPTVPVTVSSSTYTLTGTGPRESVIRLVRDTNGNGRSDKGEPVAATVALHGTQTEWDAKVSLAADAVNRFVVTADPAGAGPATAVVPAITHVTPPTLTSVGDAPDPFSPNKDGVADTTTISYALSRPAAVTVSISDSQGRPVTVLLLLALRPAGVGTVKWDGRNVKGVAVADGTYAYRVDAVALGYPLSTKTGTVRVDTHAPTVAMTNPTNGTRTSNRSLAATATDAGDVTGVVFETSTDGSPWSPVGPADVTAPYTGSLPLSLPDGTYRIRARATDNAGVSATSPPVTATLDTTAPAAPTGLTAHDVPGDTGGAVALSWTRSTSGDVAGQCVFRADGDGAFLAVATLDGTVASWTDHGLMNGTEYRYLLQAIDTVGLTSPYSAEAGATPTDDSATGSSDSPTGPTPTDPTATPTQPTPREPSEPTPTEPSPTPTDPGTPTDPTTTPTDPTTTPTDPTTTPTDPTTTPTDPGTPGDPGDLPPDPASVASPLDPSVPTDLGDATAFLYTGADPIQIGVSPGTIKGERAAVVRGTVHTRGGDPLSGVTVSVADHPEFGHTVSRADGGYDLAVNGGGRLVVVFAKAGYPSAQRDVLTDWQDYAVVDDVTLIPYDTAVTPVELGGNGGTIQVAQGSPVTDGDGSRRATLLFPAGTRAQAKLPNGSTVDLTDAHVRATEFTVGDDGPAAMPGDLPAMSAYTYAAEFSVDEAVALGADTVTFSQPVIDYTQNFLNFPVGTPVPTGYYDRTKHAWIAAKDGRVIKILSITAGVATVDVAGKGVAANAAELSALGVTTAELTKLGTLYPAGTSLWRVAIDHFTPWDHNWPFSPPQGAVAPQLPELSTDAADICQGDVSGSVIGCDDQTLGERIPVSGTGLTLAYQNQRTPGRNDRMVVVPVTGATIPGAPTRVLMKVEVAGQSSIAGWEPRPNIVTTANWDGKDAFGRTVQGAALMRITVGYVYPGSYALPTGTGSGFGNYGAGAIDGDRTRQEVTLWSIPQEVPVGGWDARGAGLGGWTLSAQHAYDPVAKVLHRGDGTDTGGGELTWAMAAFAGNGTAGSGSDGGAAVSAPLRAPQGVTVAPDGTVYIADTSNNRIRRVGLDGTITTIAGTGAAQDLGDGGPAVSAAVMAPQAVAVADGGVLMSTNGHKIRRIAPNGTITTIAGTGATGWSGDSGPATAATLYSVTGMEFAPDGTLYLADTGACLIRAIGADGTIRRIAGVLPAADANDPRCGFGSDGAKADKTLLNRPTDVAVMPDGSLIIADSVNNRVRKVGTDGTVSTLISGNTPSSVEALPDGGVLVFDSFTTNRLRLVGTDGSVRVVAGTGLPGNTGDGGPAPQASLNHVAAMAVRADGAILLADSGNNRVRAITAPLPGQTSDQATIVAADGSEVYHFVNGRHVTTANAFTGATTATLGYDAAGRLVSVADGDGNLTRIERDAGGKPTAIVAAGGQRTTLALDAAGYLSAVTAPGGATTTFTTQDNGLLRTMTEPGGGVHSFDYDYFGRLTKDASPDGLSTRLNRTATASSHTVTMTSSSGQVSSITVERLPGRVQRRTTVAPTGATVVGVVAADGTRTVTEPDGSVMTVVLGPDPRFGMAAPIMVSQTLKTPGGVTSTGTLKATAELTNQFDPMSLVKLTNTFTTNGRTATTVYTAATRTITTTSPGGRVRVTTLDDQGRILSASGNGLAPVTMVYAANGLLLSREQGGQASSYSYDDRMRIKAVTDPAHHVTQYGYDDADQLTSLTSPGGGLTTYGYDDNGRVISVALPSGRVHRFSYDAGGRATTDDPAGNGAWSTVFDSDGRPTTRTRPDDVSTTLGYATNGLLSDATETAGTVRFDYQAAAAQLTKVSIDTGDGTAQTRAFDFDGPLLVGATVTGSVSATFTFAYNSDMLPTTTTLTSGSDSATIGRSYDADLGLVKVGGFTITRNAGGAAGSMSDGTGTWTYHYDAFARIDSQKLVVAGHTVYQIDLTYGPDGSLTRRVEQTDGQQTLDYHYDADGRLTDVLRDGVPAEHYAYDADGRRTSTRLDGGAATTIGYDDADRITTAAGVAYTYTADGSLAGRGSDTFGYGFGGHLTSATVGGTTVSYVSDADGRRITRTDAGGTTQYLYGSVSSPWRVSAIRTPDGVLTTLLYDEYGHLASFTRAGQTYYVATDQVGSPRVVSDATGTVVKTVDYDAFGRVRVDSAASFSVPLGFAGGLADPVTGLLRFGLRDYDPVTGRWTTRDPAGLAAGPDAYAYVGQDPASHIDPSGLSEAEDEEDPMTQDIKLDLWQYNKERLERLYESAKDGVRGFLASKLCLGQVCVNPDHPELSVGQDVKIGTGDNAVVSVGLKCSVGITENPNLHEDNFDWKAKFAAAIPSLKKIPLVGKYFGIDETYSGSGGAVNNFFGLNRTLMHGPELGVGVKGVDDMNTYGGGVPESDVNYGGN